MINRFFARLHVWLFFTLRSAPQRGQGTVEYVALILLVAAVLAAAVGVAGSGKFDLETVVTDQLTKAIKKVSGK